MTGGLICDIDGVIADTEGLLDAWLTADDVEHVKPHPEIYLAAAHTMGVEPACCIGVEDTSIGIEAVQAAGMTCIAITNSFPAEVLSEADHIIASLSELNLGVLEALLPA